MLIFSEQLRNARSTSQTTAWALQLDDDSGGQSLSDCSWMGASGGQGLGDRSWRGLLEARACVTTAGQGLLEARAWEIPLGLI